ncbi:MAG: hypothetical protein GY703_01300 [Gammaproteobacteria bacterium]|nr:hypothetical protein [Gammaproteobacteria bacterium]
MTSNLWFSGGVYTLTIRNRVIKAALLYLAKNPGRYVGYSLLLEEVARMTGIRDSEQIRVQLSENLLRLILGNAIDINGNETPMFQRNNLLVA